MFETISHEFEVNVPASEAWKLYGTLQLCKLVEEKLPYLISKIDVLQGDGGPGTILEVFSPPGPQKEVTSFKEMLTVVDDGKRVKASEIVEGSFLELGFTMYRVQIEIKDKEEVKNQCITKATIEYEVKDECADNASLVSMERLATIINCANDYLQTAAAVAVN